MGVVLLSLDAVAQGGPVVVSPQVNADNTVTFRLLAPSAKAVKLNAQFEKVPLPMVKDAQGVWSVTTGPVKIAGFSAGGGTSLFIGLNNPDLFSWVVGFAPGMLKDEFDRNNATAFANPPLTNQRLKLFWIGVGKDDGLYPVINEYLTVLDEKKIKHETLISDGGHTWMNCKVYLANTLPQLFN